MFYLLIDLYRFSKYIPPVWGKLKKKKIIFPTMELKFKINAVKANNVFLTRKVLKHFVDRMLETSMDEKKFQ